MSITATIGERINQPLFADAPARRFFEKWCKINDSIAPEFVPRDIWDSIGFARILEPDYMGHLTLFVPQDLHLWEVVDIVRVVDNDTLSESPEKRGERVEKLVELGEIFSQAGIYIHSYLPFPGEDTQPATQLASGVALQFYQYGLLLQGRAIDEYKLADEVQLTEDDKTKVDIWFLDWEAYQKRLTRLGENPTPGEKDELRIKLLSVYFRALCREGFADSGDRPWEMRVGPMQDLHDRTAKQIEAAIKTPARELNTAIFVRGAKKLVTEIQESPNMYEGKTSGWRGGVNRFLKSLGFDVMLAQQRLYDSLQIDKLKVELSEVKASGNTAKISVKELEVAKRVQKAVASFPTKLATDEEGSPNTPTDMIKTQFINCLGSSILGGGVLDELGIDYAHVAFTNSPTSDTVFDHSMTILLTSDGRGYWQDFDPANRSPLNYREVTQDIGVIDFGNLPESGRIVPVQNWTISGRSIKCTVFRKHVGLQCQVLADLAQVLGNLGELDAAVVAGEQAVSVNPQYATPYVYLGVSLEALGEEARAIEIFQKALSIDPRSPLAYEGLGRIFQKEGRVEEAINLYRQIVDLEPTYTVARNALGNILLSTGRYEEAIEVYRQATEADPQYVYPYYGLGNALLAEDRYEEAIGAYRQAIRIDPQYVYPYNGLGVTLIKLGRYDEALTAFREGLEIDPHYPRLHQGIAEALVGKGDMKAY